MTDLDQRLRADLSAVADSVTVPALPDGRTYRANASRRRWNVTVTALSAAAAVVAVIASTVVVIAHQPNGIPSTGTTFASWPARGDLANDTALVGAAIATWEAAPIPARELPHTDARLLYATRTEAGDTVVLTGKDAFGRQRIAWFNTDPTSRTPFRHRLHLVADVLAPTDDRARLIVLYAPRSTPRPTDDAELIALAPPGTNGLQWRDEVRGWRSFATTDGAGALLVVSSNPGPDISVRVGHDGGGVQSLDDVFDIGPIINIAHDLDPQEVPKSTSSNEHCDSNGVCSDSASGQATIHAIPENGGWTDLRDGQPSPNGNTPNGDWPEFASEALLFAATRHPSDGESFNVAFSELSAAGTGVFVIRYSPSATEDRLIVYIDRPEWYGGRAIDVDASQPYPAIATAISYGGHLHLVGVATDGLRLQWSPNGGRTWTNAPLHNHVADTVVPATNVTWRAIDASGAVVTSGTPAPTYQR